VGNDDGARDRRVPVDFGRKSDAPARHSPNNGLQGRGGGETRGLSLPLAQARLREGLKPTRTYLKGISL
jgi:hypothetical protein